MTAIQLISPFSTVSWPWSVRSFEMCSIWGRLIIVWWTAEKTLIHMWHLGPWRLLSAVWQLLGIKLLSDIKSLYLTQDGLCLSTMVSYYEIIMWLSDPYLNDITTWSWRASVCMLCLSGEQTRRTVGHCVYRRHSCSLHFNAQGVCEIWQAWACVSVFVYARVSVCVITEGKQEERQKMNMLYGSSKILHGPSAREEPRAECLWPPNIINYLCAFTSSCCVWPAMSLRSRTGVGVSPHEY